MILPPANSLLIEADRMPTVSAVPAPSRKAVQRGTGQGLTSGFGMGPGVSPIPVTVGIFSLF